jgi:hypothetical protein
VFLRHARVEGSEETMVITAGMTADPLVALDWDAVAERLWSHGFAHQSGAIGESECAALIALYGDDARFRSTVRMQAHGFGRGEYRYFAYPLPPLVAEIRASLYRRLAPIANAWNEAMRSPERYPLEVDAYLDQCLRSGQMRPTPLLLRYDAGDYNCLHQDVYGELAFPLQATLYLSARSDYAGGETVLAMQRPRAQSRAAVIVPERGDVLIFPNRYRPVRTTAGFARENVRHGVSEVRSGRRFALGVIFHDAR